jgi:hypothetical protein
VGPRGRVVPGPGLPGERPDGPSGREAGTCRTNCASAPWLALGALRTDPARGADGANRTLGPSIPRQSWNSLRALDTGFSLGPLRSLLPYRALGSLGTLGAGFPLWSLRPHCTHGSLRTDWARVTSWPGRALGPSRAILAGLSLRPLGALRSLRALRPDRSDSRGSRHRKLHQNLCRRSDLNDGGHRLNRHHRGARRLDRDRVLREPRDLHQNRRRLDRDQAATSERSSNLPDISGEMSPPASYTSV